jgi:hypothetical protein
MNKKKFLTESDRKKIISDKEKAILESFAKTFNKIKRVDENEVNKTFTGGEDYEKIGREVEYGINPYEGESNVSFEPMNNDEKKMLSYVSKYVGSELELSDEMDNYRNLGYQGFSDNVKNALRNDMDYQTWVQMSHDEDTFRRERGF